jgi:hypothetical protein
MMEDLRIISINILTPKKSYITCKVMGGRKSKAGCCFESMDAVQLNILRNRINAILRDKKKEDS